MNRTGKPALTRVQDQLMRKRGYLSISTIARQCGVTRATVDLWLKQEPPRVRYTRVGLRIFVERRSLEQFLGPEGSKMLDAGAS